MTLVHAILLAVVQGVTEFLPISSSAHLILMPHLLGWRDQGVYFDVATNTGTLLAVLLYLRREVALLTRNWFVSLTGGETNAETRLAWAVLWGTLPAAVAGFFVARYFESSLRTPLIIALASIGFGLLLWWADRGGRGRRSEYDLRVRDVAVVGCAQALALIPGTSRSGITMTAGVARGLSRSGAARFSFLLAIPVSVLAGGLDAVHLLTRTAPVPWGLFAVGFGVAFVAGYAVIDLFLRLIERVGFTPFVIYRVALGIFLLWYFN